MGSRRRQLSIPLAVALLLAAGAAHAITISVTGSPGADGVGVDGGPGDPADATATSGDPTNVANATGGRGGASSSASAGAGGDASAHAETNVATPAIAAAFATGGGGGDASFAGGVGGAGGDATAEAHAVGGGGSLARAIATGGSGAFGSAGALGADGGDAMLVDAVSGSDPVALTLQQIATGGAHGSRSFAFGDAVATGDFDNAAGGDLVVTLFAEGGNAHVGGSATGAGDVSLAATARAIGGTLEIDPLLAQATGGGDASASLEADQRADGSILSLTNAVDATAGSGATIALRQTVKADATSESVLDVTRSAALLELEANAEGGDARIFVRGSNDAGDVRLGGQAIGGGDPDADPFHAVAEFEATTSGDGHDIEIGSPSRAAGAVGGSGDNGNPDVRGGDAEVVATGIALGNSSVHIDVVAEGGLDHDGIAGGNALARAEGMSGGTETVEVIAAALGDRTYYGSPAGNAVATALASGAGVAIARAVAHGGFDFGNPGFLGSTAFARASASGASGEVEAIASTSVLYDGDDADDEQLGPIEVALATTVTGDTAVAASSRQQEFAAGSNDPALDGFIRSAYHADAPLMGAALAGNPLASAAGVRPRQEVFALVEMSAISGGGIARTFEADIILGHPSGFNEWDDVPEAVLVSFLDPELDAAAFGSLTLRSWDIDDPSDVYEVVFTSAFDALAFLDDGRLLFLGEPTQRHLEIVFETTGAEGAFFLDLVVAAVPEPRLGLLLGLAALAAGSGRYRYTLLRSPMRKTTTTRTRSSIE